MESDDIETLTKSQGDAELAHMVRSKLPSSLFIPKIHLVIPILSISSVYNICLQNSYSVLYNILRRTKSTTKWYYATEMEACRHHFSTAGRRYSTDARTGL